MKTVSLITLTISSFLIASCSGDNSEKNLVYCPSADAVNKSISQNMTSVQVDIGQWNINLLRKTGKINFQKATYLAGWPACIYGPPGEDPSIELSPDVTPELFPIWQGTTGKNDQWSASSCSGDIKNCPWNAVPWNSSNTPSMP